MRPPKMSHSGLLFMSFGVGILVGLTSMGGAALMTPLLLLFAGMQPVVAVGTDLAYGAVTKIVGAWMHWRQKTVDLRVALLMACGSIPGGTVGFLAIRISACAWLQRRQVREAVNRNRAGDRCRGHDRPNAAQANGVAESSADAVIRKRQSYAWGFVIGFAVGLTSVGSGSLIAPFLMMLFPNNPSRVVGTDVFHAAMLVSATAMLHAKPDMWNGAIVPIMLGGSIPGVLLGSYLAPRLPSRPLRFGLGGILFATGYQLVFAH